MALKRLTHKRVWRPWKPGRWAKLQVFDKVKTVKIFRSYSDSDVMVGWRDHESGSEYGTWTWMFFCAEDLKRHQRKHRIIN